MKRVNTCEFTCKLPMAHGKHTFPGITIWLNFVPEITFTGHTIKQMNKQICRAKETKLDNVSLDSTEGKLLFYGP